MLYEKQISDLVARAARAGARRSWAGSKEDPKEEHRRAAAELKKVREAFASLIAAAQAEPREAAREQADFEIQEAAELEYLANTQAALDLMPEADR